jgi:hypothetical protein
MTKEEAWIMWMKESAHYVGYDWDTIKRSSHWESFSRGWDAATINVNGWDDAYKMGMEAGKELAQREWQGLTDEEVHEAFCYVEYETPNDWERNPELWCLAFSKYIEAKLKEQNS